MRPSNRFASKSFDRSRYSCYQSVDGHIFMYHCTCSNNGPVANFYSVENGASGANPNIAAYFNSALALALRSYVCVKSIEIMVCCEYLYVGSN